MTERQAREQGLGFTGVSTRDNEEAKRRAKEIRDQGFRAVVTNNHPGYSSETLRVYAEQKYFIKRNIESMKQRLSMVDAQRKQMKDDYEKNLAAFEKSVEESKRQLAEMETKLAE